MSPYPPHPRARLIPEYRRQSGFPAAWWSAQLPLSCRRAEGWHHDVDAGQETKLLLSVIHSRDQNITDRSRDHIQIMIRISTNVWMKARQIHSITNDRQPAWDVTNSTATLSLLLYLASTTPSLPPLHASSFLRPIITIVCVCSKNRCRTVTMELFLLCNILSSIYCMKWQTAHEGCSRKAGCTLDSPAAHHRATPTAKLVIS